MGNVFKQSPEESIREGKTQISHAGEMKHITSEIYKEVEELLRTGYTSPAARELYTQIQSNKMMLDGVTKTFANYGSYLVEAGGQTINVDEEIAKGIKVGEGVE